MAHRFRPRRGRTRAGSAPPRFLTRVKHFADNLTPQCGARDKSETVARPMSGYGSESDAQAFN